MSKFVNFEIHVRGNENNQKKFEEIISNINRIQDYSIENRKNNTRYIK